MYDHSFSELANRQIRHQSVSLVIAYSHLIFLRGLCGYVWSNILTLSPPRVLVQRSRVG